MLYIYIYVHIHTYIRHICRRHTYIRLLYLFVSICFLHVHPPQREYACNVTTPDPDKVPQRLPCRCGRKGSTRMILEKRKSAILRKVGKKPFGVFEFYRFYGLVGNIEKHMSMFVWWKAFAAKRRLKWHERSISISYKKDTMIVW